MNKLSFASAISGTTGGGGISFEVVDGSASQLHGWLMTLPADSLARLRTINMSTVSSKHVILSLAYGIYDRHIGKLNRIITSLLISRLKAERAGRTAVVARINDFMEEMHEAIDMATGTAGLRRKTGHACNRTMRVAS